ncbi:hypothetical protein C8J36_11116 [Rhizobium sp. PP-F2F-G48]|nr:hypothetical protein C8J36_11116 [Rhizobium sp. PP-F2F-G48]
MSHDDPFTLDLFGSSSLSSGFHLGVTAFAPGPDLAPDDDDPPPASPAAALTPSASRRATAAVSRERGENFHLDGVRGLARSWKARARDALAAIRLAAEIEGAVRPATRASRRSSSALQASAPRSLRPASSAAPARMVSPRVGRKSVRNWRLPSRPRTMPRSPAAPSMPNSRRSSSCGQSGPGSSGWDGGEGVCWSRGSARASSRP